MRISRYEVMSVLEDVAKVVFVTLILVMLFLVCSFLGYELASSIKKPNNHYGVYYQCQALNK